MKHLVRIIIFLTTILFVVPLHGQEKGEPKTIRVGVFQLEPLIFTDHDGKIRGLYPDLIKKIANKEHWTVEFVPGSWAEGLNRLQREEIDLMPAIAVSPDRDRIMDFSRESVFDLWGQVFLRPGHTINTIMDLEGRRIAVMDQDISGENFVKTAEKFGITCDIIPMTSFTDVFHAVQKGDAAAGVVAQHFGLTHNREFELVASPIQFSPFSIYFAAKKGLQGNRLTSIDSYMYRWKLDRDSYYHNRLTYWMAAKGYEKEIIPRWLLMAVAAIAGILALMAYINRVLNLTVKKRTQELHSREKQYRDLVESANCIILRMDKHGRVLFINRFGLNLFGYSRDEIYGRNVIGTILTKEEANKHHLKPIAMDIFKLPEAFELVENENICKDGRRVYIQWSNRAITNDQGDSQEILSIGSDITQRRELESSLHQAQKMEAIGTLAGGIAHDFNNILTVIFGYTELANLYIDNPEKTREALAQVTKSGERAKDLVSQILTFSRTSESKKQPLQPSLIINETIKLLRPSLPATIKIETTLTSKSKIKADPTQIHQIIMNLCTNAYHAMEATEGTLRISLEDISVQKGEPCSPEWPLQPGEYVLLDVSDTGWGIEPETMQKIFDPYFTTKVIDKGTGLGLSVVHGIVKEHKGHITVRSIPGEGTAFQVFLPIIQTETKPAPEEPAAKGVTGGDETILLIDDEKEITAALSAILSRHGYDVRAFTDGVKAMKSFREKPHAIDLVITDMTMPGMTGSQLAREMLALRPELPVILCTGYSDLMTLENSREIGIAEYLQKPVMITTLLRKVRKQLDGKQGIPANI